MPFRGRLAARMRAARGLSAGIVALIPLSSGMAQAEDLGTSGGITYIRESQSVTDGDDVSLIANCPPVRLVPANGSVFGTINSVTPLDANDPDEDHDDGWVAHMVNSTNDPATAESYVICADGKATIRTSREKTVKGGKTAAVKAACPKGKWVTGGGLLANGAIDDGWISGSIAYDDGDPGKAPNGWRGRFADPSSADSQKVRAYAVCWNIPKPRYKFVKDSAPAGFASTRTHTGDGEVLGVGTDREGRWPITQAQPIDSPDDADSIPDDGGSFAARNPTERDLKWRMLTIHAR